MRFRCFAVCLVSLCLLLSVLWLTQDAFRRSTEGRWRGNSGSQVGKERLATSAPRDCSIGKLFCSTLAGSSSCATHGKALYGGPTQIYVAHADAVSRVQRAFGAVPQNSTRPWVYATVVGSLAGLNGLLTIQPREAILFFDINPWMVEYATMVVELIKKSPSRGSFLSSLYGRQLGPYLDEQNPSPQRDPLDTDQDMGLLTQTRMALPEGTQCAFDYLQQEYMRPKRQAANSTVQTHKNCEEILLFYPPEKYPPLNPRRHGVYSRSADYAPNICTFYYGHGWLSDQASYSKVREALSAKALFFVPGRMGVGLETVLAQTPPAGRRSVTIYTSNIETWAGRRAFRNEKDTLRNYSLDSATVVSIGTGASLPLTSKPAPYLLTSKPAPLGSRRAVSGLVQAACPTADGRAAIPRKGLAHRHAWSAVQAALRDKLAEGLASDRVLEVARRVPWGFFELKGRRSNVVVEDYLADDQRLAPPTTMLHILVGEGLSKAVWREVAAKALGTSERVVVLEHNAASQDWGAGKNEYGVGKADYFTFGELESELRTLTPGGAVNGCLVAGVVSTTRNMLFVARRKA